MDSGVGFVRIENLLDNHKISTQEMKYVSADVHQNELKRSILCENDLLITIAGTLGKTAIVEKNVLPLNTNQAISFVRLVNNKSFDMMYLCYMISSKPVQDRLLSKTKVTSIPNLTLEIISNCLIPLAPFNEQIRITKAIETYFTILENIEKSLS